MTTALLDRIDQRRERATIEAAIRFAQAGTQAKSRTIRETATERLAELQTLYSQRFDNLHGSHCFDDGVPVCGWPEMHR
jgi:hypothetical protein